MYTSVRGRRALCVCVVSRVVDVRVCGGVSLFLPFTANISLKKET